MKQTNTLRDLQELAELVRPLDKLRRDELQGTKGANHEIEKIMVEEAYRKWKVKNGTPLEQYVDRLNEKTLPEASEIWLTE